MDTRKIRKLIELVKETGIGELEVKSGDDCVRINCQLTTTPTYATMAAPIIQHTTQAPAATTTAEPATPAKKPVYPDGHVMKSPMVGTVYLAASPGNPPLVTVGQTIKAGDTLCLIEAMKMFNKIEADKSGTISARLIENEQPVEYDQPLFIIEVE